MNVTLEPNTLSPHRPASPLAPTVEAAKAVEDDLAALRQHIERAREILDGLQTRVPALLASTGAAEAALLLAANEELVLAMVRTQTEAEASARDIAFREQATRLRLESQRLGEENRQLAEASRLKSQFLANMSHELRTPLNAIVGFTQLLRLGHIEQSAPEYATYLGHIGDSGTYLLNLVSGLLDLTRVASGKLDFVAEPVSLTEVAREVVDMLQATALQGKVTLAVAIEPAVDGVVVDRTRLKQVLTNYVSNAVKFSHAGGHVRLDARAVDDDWFRVDVHDDGIGIPAADQPRLFVPFSQVDSSHTRTRQGVGIGLSLTKMLVEAQGGSVSFRSTPGTGSTFSFVLRRIAAAA